MTKEESINAGFTVVETDNTDNKLLNFLKEHYPNVIRENEIKMEELKTALGLPIDEKVNGYGLNFVGRNFAKAKYAQKTEKELSLNTPLSKNVDSTQNLVLKGDNLDSLKILKNYYNEKIKCIYIDPPYNTTSDEFVYPDKFDKEETEVLGLANLSGDEYARMDFSFKTKKSHNGWLAFMYPRLLLARDLLSKDGVIFISIDDNEQANLKLLCDEVFGEENFVANIIWERAYSPVNLKKHFSESHDFIMCYSKNMDMLVNYGLKRTDEANARYSNPDNDSRGTWTSSDLSVGPAIQENIYEIVTPSGREVLPPSGYSWRLNKERFQEFLNDNRIWFGNDGNIVPRIKRFLSETKNSITPMTIWKHSEVGHSQEASQSLKKLFDGEAIFDYPKPINLLKRCFELYCDENSTILDFFAGSGTTGQAVMQLNAEYGGKRKFILCQIDEAIKEDKPAYTFCVENKLPPIISSITVERLKRAGEKIAKDVEEANLKAGMYDEHKKQVPDVGFKVFDSVAAPKLQVDETTLQITMSESGIDALSRIYNMIFTVGLDTPTQAPETVVENCIYKIGTHYYITNSGDISQEDFSAAIKNGKVFIDGWTASLNGTLQHYKEDVKIVF
jgi:adenine-specific DNA-methyltransferase